MKQSQNNIENKISWEDIKEYILDRQPYDYKAKPVKMDDVILIDNNAYIKETIIEWLDEVRNSDKLKDYNILPTKTLFLTGAPGLGKAQPLTSHVFTPTGYKTMEEIKLGDKVIDGKGEITEVIGTFLQGKRDCYRIYFKDNSYIEVADNHLNSIWKEEQYINEIITLDLINIYKNNNCYIEYFIDKNCKEKLKRKICLIEYIGKKDCKCILVKSDMHQYITDNLTVTHNTYMAKAVATELKWPMYIIDVAGVMKQNGLDALIKIFSFVRDPQNQPCILFLDECDGVARSREEKGSSADKAGDNRITNYIMQVLQEENDNIDSQLIIFAATNFPEGIDEAFLNRFQIQLMYYLPEDYVPFIKLEMKKNKMFTLVEDVDPELIKSINIEANNAKFSIRALNAKILWIYKQTLLQKIKNHDLHGEVIEIKLSTIMQSIANDIKFGIDINKIQDDEKKLKDDFKDIVENASETKEKEI